LAKAFMTKCQKPERADPRPVAAVQKACIFPPKKDLTRFPYRIGTSALTCQAGIRPNRPASHPPIFRCAYGQSSDPSSGQGKMPALFADHRGTALPVTAQIEMEMILVIGVGLGPKDGGEARAGRAMGKGEKLRLA